MREKETESSQGARYMSPLVRQDLARLDKDGESRRSAMNSLKLFVENLDPGSMPRFLAQVSEARDQGASRSYAVSLYEEVARVHGKLIIPHIPRVMATVTRSLSSSGSSPQLHQACAKVVSAVARYSIDGGSREQADDILRELCGPLLGILVGKLGPLAAGAAVCLQALVESEKWKYASDEVVNETCLRTTVALGEKATRTVAHMQLARSLATTCPSFFTNYGVALLRTGSEVLCQIPVSGTWQQRACAAHLLQVVLPTVDRATLDSELEHTIQALDDCKHDRMVHVRSAVTEALKTAKMLCFRDSLISCDGQDRTPKIQYLSSLAGEAKQPRKPCSEMRSLFDGREDVHNSGTKQGSSRVDFLPEDNMIYSLLSYGSPDSSQSAQHPRVGKHRRLSFSPTSRISKVCSPQTSSVSCVDDLEGCCCPGRACEVQAEENIPSRNLELTAGVPCDSGPSSCGSSCSGHVGKHVRPSPSTPRFNIPYPPLLGDEIGTDQQSRDIEGTNFDMEVETGTNSNQCLPGKQSWDNHVGFHNNSFGLVSNRSESSESQTILNWPTRKIVYELEGSAAHMTIQSVSAQNVGEGLHASCGAFVSHLYKKPFVSSFHQDSLLPRLQSLEVVSSLNKPKALITAEDFRPLIRPGRLVRSLQSNLSTTPSSGNVKDQDTKLLDEGAHMADMDLETYSDVEWSVRNNPIASDDSLKTHSEEDDQEQQGITCKKMNVNSSERCYSADLDANHLYTSDCERLSLALVHAADSLFCTSTGWALESEFRKEDVDHNGNGFCITSAHSQEPVLSSIGKNCLLTCSCNGKASNQKESFEGGDHLLGNGEEGTGIYLRHEPCQDMAIGEMWIRFRHSIRSISGKRLRILQVYTEMFLSGFLLATVALPFAMVMSKILWSPVDHPGLIPT